MERLKEETTVLHKNLKNAEDEIIFLATMLVRYRKGEEIILAKIRNVALNVPDFINNLNSHAIEHGSISSKKWRKVPRNDLSGILNKCLAAENNV